MRLAFDQTAFDRWLQATSKQGPPLVATRARYAGLQNEPSRPVVANGILAGTRSAQALERDRAYVDAAPPGKIEALKSAPATGCSMLLTLAREKSGYDCQTPGQPGSEQKFMLYITQILVCPLFQKEIDDRITNAFTGDWNNVINTIVDLYVGLPSSDKDILRRSLLTVAAAASSSPSTVERVCTFFQSTIDSSDELTIFFYYMDVKMITYVERGGKNEPDRVHNQAELSLHRVKMRFNSSQWAGQAEAVYRETQSSLTGWLESNSTPIGSLPNDWHPR